MSRLKAFQSTIREGQAGFSLVSLLVALGILGVVAYSFIHSYNQMQFSQRNHQAGMAARDIEQVILSSLIQKQINYININRCTSSIATYFNNVSAGAGTNILNAPLAFRNLDRVTIISPPASANNAVQRCNAMARYNGSTAANSTTHYHCLRIDTTMPAGAARHTFITNLGAFVELFVRIRDLATNAALTCSTAAVKNTSGVTTNLGNGIDVLYNLHWTLPNSTGKILYKSKVGSVRVAL